MKLFSLGTVTVLVCMVSCFDLSAQYKGPRDYFPKNSPAPPARGTPSAAPQTPAKPEPAKTQQPKFKDIPVNGQFYFLSDTNRTVAWTKISASTAKNPKNGVTRALSTETPVQK